MKNLLKRVSVLLLALTLSLSCFVGCGQPPVRDADQKLEVFIANRGYGIAGVTAALKAFSEQDWVKAKYPNLEIPTPVAERTPDYGITKIKSPSSNQFDLIFVIESLTVFFGKNSRGESTLVELTDVYDSVVPGENVKVKDKLYPEMLDYCTYTPKGQDTQEYYDFPWCTGYLGLVYNPEIVKRYVEEVPRTTDELLALMEKIKTGDTLIPATTDLDNPANRAAHNLANAGNASGFAIGPCGDASYDSYMFGPWWAQYDGYDAYNNFFDGIYTDKTGTQTYSHKIFELEGRLESLRVLDKMLQPSSGYYDLSLTEEDFMAAQATLLKGEYAMTSCADWFDTEMKLHREEMIKEVEDGVPGAQMPADLLVLQTPIISAIVKQLKFRNGGEFMSDAQLSFLVECIDERKDYNTAKADFATAYPGAEELKKADYTRLLEARSIYNMGAMGHTACIPSVSNSIDVAKDFVRFFYSDVCQLAYMEATQGQNIPMTFDPNSTAPVTAGATQTIADAYKTVYGKCSPMQQARLTFMFNTFNPPKTMRGGGRKPLPSAGLSSLYGTSDPGKIFRGTESESAESIFYATIDANDEESFKFKLFEAGLSDSY